LGTNHPDTLTAAANLAEAYQVTGQVGRSVRLLKRVLASREQVFSSDHPITVNTLLNLAEVTDPSVSIIELRLF
jgi:hypothetical protein